MQIFKSAMPCSRSAVLASAIMMNLLILPLIFVTKPSLGPQLSCSQMVPTLMSGSSVQKNAGGNPPVTDGAIVYMEYTITIPESDLTIPNNLGLFEQGHHDLFPNVEKALTGMKKGEEKHIDLSSDEAFGPYDASKRVEVSKDLLPADVQPGMAFVTEEGIPFVVVDLVGPMAELDFNHPLAGRHVVIDVRILNVEIPSDGEQNFQPDDGDVADGLDFNLLFSHRRSYGI